MTPIDVLRRSALFKDFSDAGVRTLAEIALEKSIPAGAPLFLENTVGESIFLLKSGTVRITQRVGDGERELANVGPGEHLGGMALLAKSVRLVSAIAVTPCEIVEIAQRDFYRKAVEKPAACLKLSLAIAGDVAARIAENRELLRELAGKMPAAP